MAESHPVLATVDSSLIDSALAAFDRLVAAGTLGLAGRVTTRGKVDAGKLEQEQLAAHALAYLETEVRACKQLVRWSRTSEASDYELAIGETYVAELARSLRGGIDLGQTETVGLSELGISGDVLADTILAPEVAAFADAKTSAEHYLAIAHRTKDRPAGLLGLTDDTLIAMQAEFRKFVDREVIPIAQQIHQKDELIPMPLIEKMAELGVFGLTIPTEYGGLGMSKLAMCVVTEELSRGYIGVGSLGTRAEIAAELITRAGTEKQRAHWLPKIARGEILPTAVFTEPNFGSDLAHVQTRAERVNGGFAIHGQKTWITHATRADLMTLLARSKPNESGYEGLSMFLASKSRAKHGGPDFVDQGLSGSEIKVLGYRGMKEYELSFDGFRIPDDALLGRVEGEGFKQLMATFESARIQTAARGVGLAQAAFNEALSYANHRIQFGRPIFEFPRVARKIARMAMRIHAARQLTYFAANMKDIGKRCDLEAGMAKLLATRVAWEAADACVQIHGGNGYAEEYTASRLLVDARVLSIFEGANEIQAHVIARRLLDSELGQRSASKG